MKTGFSMPLNLRREVVAVCAVSRVNAGGSELQQVVYLIGCILDLEHLRATPGFGVCLLTMLHGTPTRSAANLCEFCCGGEK